MAINVDTQDLLNFPGNVKRVTVDQESVIPLNMDGDEKFILNFSTTAYSDITSRTQIQDLYITDFKSGWCKSSGFVGSNIALDSTNNSLEIKIDSTVSGIGDGYYRVELEHNEGIPISAEVIAADLETKIRAIADLLNPADVGYKLSYMNASVEFKNNRFWIVSGSLSEYYTGTNKSSVKVRASSVNDCSAIMGFNINIDSEVIDSYDIKEALVVTDYTVTSGTGQITISSNIGVSTNDCLMITDRINTDYLQVTSVIDNINISFSGASVLNSYNANEAKVQLLREQDPDADPALWFNDIDKITRHGIKTIISQIDYSE